ncbi:MAG: uridine kinase [Proteobacteria bacterium]|nr:MAG: uridine kinase [Pseudomonadota bacterium]
MMRPFFVGIAGGTGSGKTTVAKKVAAGLPAGSSVIIEHDNYYRDRTDISLDERKLLNYDHPDSLDNDLFVEHLRTLRDGVAIDMPIYDYVTHSRQAERQRLAPAPVVVVEGILVFVDERIRRQLDMKIFVDTDADIRIMRRVRRDIEDRGRDFASIREQYYATVRPMHLRYVEPSKRWADLIIPEGGANVVALDTIINNLLYVISAPARAAASLT